MTKIQVSVEQINRLVSAAGLNDAQRLMQLQESLLLMRCTYRQQFSF